jgi:hypothetical protein
MIMHLPDSAYPFLEGIAHANVAGIRGFSSYITKRLGIRHHIPPLLHNPLIVITHTDTRIPAPVTDQISLRPVRTRIGLEF